MSDQNQPEVIEQPSTELESTVVETVDGDSVNNESEVSPDYVEEVQPEIEPTDSKNVAKRINKLSKKLAEKDSEIEYLRNQMSSVQKAPSPSVQDGSPKLADFASFEEYTEAVTDWKFEQRQAKQQQEAAHAAKINKYYQNVTEFSKTAPDFKIAVEEIQDELSSDPNVVEFILESDFGPAVAYHLANHEDELTRLAKMSPVRRIAALSKIESEMASRNKPKAQKPQANNTSTKTPATRVTINTGAVDNSESVNKDKSYSEWVKWRNQNKKR